MAKDDRPFKIRPPKDLAEYIRRNCARHSYMFFSDKIGKAMCSRCGTEFDLADLPHMKHEASNRVQIWCPECGTQVTPKDMRYGRKKLTDRGRITWTKAIKGVTFFETDEFIIDYKAPHPTVLIAPVEMIRLSAKSQERWDWDWWDGWYQVKVIDLKAPPQVYAISDWHDHLYDRETGQIDVGTDLRYANRDVERFYDMYFDERWMIARLIRYLSDFLKYPAIEILEKSGFETIVANRANGVKSKYINIRAKDLRKILKVDGADVKALRQIDPSIGFMESLHQIRKKAPWAKVEDIAELGAIMGRFVDARKMAMVETHTDMSKLYRRLLEERRATGDLVTLGDYADYLEAVVRLGRRLDKRTLYPKNFLEAHDQAMQEAEENKSSIDAANFARFQTEITGMTEPYISGDLLIRPAKTPQELRNESQALNHCVRTYVEDVSAGRTSILFIRKTEAPEKPYYTLELNREGRVVQCRGFKNKAYPLEVGKFIHEWEQWRKKGRRTA